MTVVKLLSLTLQDQKREYWEGVLKVGGPKGSWKCGCLMDEHKVSIKESFEKYLENFHSESMVRVCSMLSPVEA